MWLVTIENDEGLWWDEPDAADTKEEAIERSRLAYPELPGGHIRGVYQCSLRETLSD